MQELTPARYLTLSGLTWEMFWVVGMVYLGSTAYFIRDWKIHQLVLTIPTFMTLAWSWLIPESPTWNLAKCNKVSAMKTTITVATRNKDESFFQECHKVHKNSSEMDLQQKVAQPGRMVDLFRHKILLKHIVVMIIVYYSATVAYYGILLYTPSLPGGI